MDSAPCPLCGIMINPEHREEGKKTWQAEFQFLRRADPGAAKSKLIDPNKRPEEDFSCFRADFVFHRACWNIVERVASMSEFSDEWLKCFVQCYIDVRPFLLRIEDEEPRARFAPDRLDEDIEKCTEPSFLGRYNRELSPGTSSISGKINIPAEITDEIFISLGDPVDVWNLEKASGKAASPHVWMTLGRMFLTADVRFSEGTTQEISERIQRAFFNIKFADDPFSHAANLKQVWENVERVLKNVDKILHKGFIKPDVTFPRFFSCSEQEKEIPLSTIHQASRIALHFVRLQHGDPHTKRVSLAVMRYPHWYYLCGLEIDGEVVGWKGDKSIELPAGSWTGLRIAFCGMLIFAVQIKSGSAWEDKWHMEEFDVDLGLFYETKEIAWDQGETSGHLTLSYDTVGISSQITHVSDSDFLGPVNWMGCPPPKTLVPVRLMDLSTGTPDQYIYFTNNINTIFGIDCYIAPSHNFISNLDIWLDGDKCIKMGYGNRSLSGKVSFRVARHMGEEISAVGYAPNHDGKWMFLKFYTNLGRSITFGDEKAKGWAYLEAPDGLFFSSSASGLWMLRTFGCFRPKNSPSALVIPPPEVTEPPELRMINVHRRDSSEQPAATEVAWITGAPLEGISEITVYREWLSNPVKTIIGLKVSYENRPAVIMGEVRDEQIPSTTVKVAGKIKQISCHYFIEPTRYGTKSRIDYIVLDIGTEDKIELGDKSDLPPHCLTVTADDRAFCWIWAYDRDFSFLSLSDGDLEVDQIRREIGAAANA
ncbi:hypothetical protein FQN55_006326 [Onygenales sp. PD_40]|nr:hypothetical protein FQN55_006326 [Onygenales sp. PD_40]